MSGCLLSLENKTECLYFIHIGSLALYILFAVAGFIDNYCTHTIATIGFQESYLPNTTKGKLVNTLKSNEKDAFCFDVKSAE